MASTSHPFLFVGQGFGTSYKCLEGHLWFEQAPRETDQAWIEQLVPLPVKLGVRFVDAVMHFGSDDLLEARVKAVYCSDYAGMNRDDALNALYEKQRTDESYLPTRSEWAAFCDDFERAVIAMHERCKLQLVLKPDDGEYGKELGVWHTWSVARVWQVAERALRDPRPASRDLSYLAVNLVQEVLRGANAVAEIPEQERRTWLAWLDRLVGECPAELRGSAFVPFVSKIVDSFPEAERDGVLRSLRDDTTTALHERARRLAERRAARNKS